MLASPVSVLANIPKITPSPLENKIEDKISDDYDSKGSGRLF